ncbi:flagellar hook-basal body complex protein [Bacillus sp. AFS040349]|uniref:flagellar hook-basal body complex protein n=1 Tax=Bacillus sp. AFS040349 TaxID=2033502 RepID=UPI000BFDCBCC|nr:flagellar hook-basal body complex protein [Bacillus sp. AFS040349]PGT86672.1 flagellar biosynthesis protein FlgE [Bacillus sp. AFS040349]
MLRSMYSGISGMKNFQMKLDVIGNNIANVNTYGYKKSRSTFKDLISQQISGAGAANGARGGTNAQQVGLGSQASSVDVIHTTGATQTTARTLDLALSGDGFFPVATISDLARVGVDRGNQVGNNKITGAIDRAMNLSYTRAGNFYMDDRGYLVTSDGYYLVGETGEKTPPTADHITKGNNALTSITQFEGSYKNITNAVKLLEKKTDTLLSAYNEYNDAVSTGMNVASAHNALTTAHADFKNFVDGTGPYNNNGFKNIAMAFNDTNVATEAIAMINKSISDATNGFNSTTPITEIVSEISTSVRQLQANEYPANVVASGTAATTDLDTVKALMDKISNFKVDLEQVAQSVVNYENAAEALLKPTWSDSLSGEAGLIQIPLDAQSFSIGPDGTVSFVNSSGQLKVAGQIRLANFANAGGLEKAGGNLFRESSNSGSVDKNANGIQLNELFAPGTNGVASIVAGALEMSNVDLSEEFTEMIVAQRGFQSNTKIITTSDEILQELVNLKR